VVSIADTVVDEKARRAYFTVTLDRRSTSAVSLNYQTALATATILDDQGSPLGQPVVSVAAGRAYVTFTLDRPSTSVVSLTYQTVDGSGVAGSDYRGLGVQTLAFAPGDRAKTVAVNIIDDTRPESGESLQLFLSNPVGAQLGTTLAFASISDDDSRFDSAYYVERNPDVAAAKIDPRTHYLSSGWAEGRDPNANVDLASVNGLDYIASYGDLMGAFGPNKAAGYRHFATAGMFEGRYTTFDGLEYIASYQDLMNVLGANADAGASHYIQTGRAQGRTITFNGLEYISRGSINAFHGQVAANPNPDLGTSHYLQAGYFENRAADQLDAGPYLANYADLRSVFGTNTDAATVHFITAGYFEGRTDGALV